METSLHRELKLHYGGPSAKFEVPLGDYRIDVVSRGRLIEIQHGALAAIRDKVRTLLESHRVLVVKPVIIRKRLIRLSQRDGDVLGRRLSPKRGRLVDVFHDLVFFTRVFPHKNLTLDIPLIDIEERRYPGHGRRRRKRDSDYVIEDQRLTAVRDVYRVRAATDLPALLQCELPEVFGTAELAAALDVPRWVAQRIAYCLRQTGGVKDRGKRGGARLYAFKRKPRKPKTVKIPVRRAA